MTLAQSFMDKIEFDANGGCWLWSACVVRGYGQAAFRGGRSRTHRIAYEVVNGPIPDGLLVRHTCDVKLCCNPAHLLVGTPADNARDAAERGQLVRGDTCGKSKLRSEQVIEIRRRLSGGERVQEIADSYGVVRRTIQFIADGITWKHLP